MPTATCAIHPTASLDADGPRFAMPLDVEPHQRVLGIGIDTADVDAVGRGLRTFGDAYLHRICSAAERAALPQDQADRTRQLAQLWAAKEAATKTLAPAMHEPWPWPAVEVDFDSGAVCLSGRPAGLAAEQHVDRIILISLGPTAAVTTVRRLPDDTASPLVRETVTVLALALADGPPGGEALQPIRTSSPTQEAP